MALRDHVESFNREPRHPSFYSDALAVDPVLSDPAIDSSSIVSNLEALALNCLYQVEILKSMHFAQDDVAHP